VERVSQKRSVILSEKVAGKPMQGNPGLKNPSSGTIDIVGIGGSTGGLEALEQFFSHLPLVDTEKACSPVQ
jgi:chemotaxis response regulator CheB